MILLTGARGQLGLEFQATFREQGISWIATDRPELDITDADQVRRFVETHDITGIINCAAYNNVDQAEAEPEACRAVNTLAPGLLAGAAREKGVPFVTYSTDFVFDGESDRPYVEIDPPAPRSVYGQSKLDGERAALEHDPGALVIRTSWLFGAHGVNFVRRFLELCASRDEIRMVTDQVSAPTCTRDLVQATLLLLERRAGGLFHVSNSGVASKYEFARELALSIGWRGQLVPVDSRAFPAPAARPAYSKLDTAKLEGVTGWRPPSWQDRVREVVRALTTRDG